MSEGLESRVAVLESELKRVQRDFGELREDCRDENENNQNIILRRMEQQELRQIADHREMMDKVNEQIGPDARRYVAASTKKVEQEMQITAAGLNLPLWRQVWSAITSNKWLMLVTLALSGALVTKLIELLQQLLILINNTTSHIWHG